MFLFLLISLGLSHYTRPMFVPTDRISLAPEKLCYPLNCYPGHDRHAIYHPQHPFLVYTSGFLYKEE